MKVLMVCLGNICRSSLAEGILKEKVQQHGLDWTVESAGTSSWHVGERPDSRGIETAKKHGIDITDQRSRQLERKDLDIYDLIYAMDASNYRDIMALTTSKEQEQKVNMILNEAFPGENKPVPDPYYGASGFDNVFELLSNACEKIIEKYQ